LSWSSAKWLTGTYFSALENIQKSISPLYQWAPTTDYNKFQSLVFTAASQRLTILYQSEIFCRFKRIAESLSGVVCDCLSDGGANCFSGAALVPTAVGRPCAGESSSVLSTVATINFAADSVSGDCVTILVSEVSRETFKGKAPQRLSSNFVAFNDFTFYSVHNNDDAVVGQVIGDGVELNIAAKINSAQVCIKYSTGADSAYDVADFATSDASLSKLTPLGLKVTDDGSQLCADLPNSMKAAVGQHVLFPIRRVADWANKEREVLSKTASQLSYTLGVFFIVVAALAFVDSILLIAKKHKIFPLSMFIMLFTTFAYTLIRAIYFFIIPSDLTAYDNAVVDYVLVVLPTFLYFTAFSTVVIIWALASLTTGSGGLKKMFNLVIILMNVGLYIVLIVICVVFQYIADTESAVCAGREELHSNTSTQLRISIAYAVIIAALSLGLSIAFVAFGSRITRTLSTTTAKATANSASRIFRAMLFYAFGFLIHCVFILVLVGAELSNVAFSFVLLVISELIPSIAMLFFNPNSILFVIFGKVVNKPDFESASASASATSTTSVSPSSVSMSNTESAAASSSQ
jgi:hypothetical protein